MDGLDPAKAEALRQAIADLIEQPMITRWVVVAETIDRDGSMNLADVTSPGLAYWDFTGMLTAALQGREAQPMWSYDDSEDVDYT